MHDGLVRIEKVNGAMMVVEHTHTSKKQVTILDGPLKELAETAWPNELSGEDRALIQQAINAAELQLAVGNANIHTDNDKIMSAVSPYLEKVSYNSPPTISDSPSGSSDIVAQASRLCLCLHVLQCLPYPHPECGYACVVLGCVGDQVTPCVEWDPDCK